MSDNKVKTNLNETAESADSLNEMLQKTVAEYTEMASDEKMPIHGGEERILELYQAERILELYQKVLDSKLPDEEKDNLTLNLLSEWGRILGNLSERTCSENEQPKLTVGYILSQIEKIQQDNEHVKEALNVLLPMHNGDSGEPGSPGNVLGAAKANAIRDIAVEREATNQKLIEFYNKLYDDIKPPRPTKETALEIISQAVNRNYSDPEPEQIANLAEAISSLLDGVRHIDH